MYMTIIGKQTVYRYRLQWTAYNGKRYYVKRTRILHSISMQDVKRKALSLFGTIPDNTQRV